MNLIKFKNIDVDLQTHPEFEKYNQWYNETIRGRYAYWVRFRYIVPLDSISVDMYVTSEIDINDLLGYDYYVLRNIGEAWKYEIKAPVYISERGETDAQDPEYPHPGKDDFILVDQIPTEPSENDLPFIKIHSSELKYIDLWDPIFWDESPADPRDNWLRRDYVDDGETNRVNDISWYLKYNFYMPVGSISLDELKKFRTWLADKMLDVKGDSLSTDNRHILEYYNSDNNMVDDTVRWLMVFGGVDVNTVGTTTVSPCGCSGNENLSSLYNETVSLCYPLKVYRDNIKQGMVNLFSNINTWTDVPEGLLDMIIMYLDGIIAADLPLISENTTDIYSCNCLHNAQSSQGQAQNLLRELEMVFEWIKTKNVSGHKNKIAQVLSDWSSNLYEIMYW